MIAPFCHICQTLSSVEIAYNTYTATPTSIAPPKHQATTLFSPLKPKNLKQLFATRGAWIAKGKGQD